MLRVLFFVFALIFPAALAAGERAHLVEAVIDAHAMPGFRNFADETEMLKHAAQVNCTDSEHALHAAFHAGFDAWLAVSHLRFGPTEEDDRAFALAFWPDPKGFTAKTLAKMISSEDTSVNDPKAFATVSIAGRGFFALELLLFDDKVRNMGSFDYRCALIRAIARDIDANADAILEDWQTGFAAQLRTPTESGVYRTEDEAVQELFKALLAGLQFTSDTRLGRPLGTFERPRPKRAEARRSGRSLRNVEQSLLALKALAGLLSQDKSSLSERFDVAFDSALKQAGELNDPVFAGVTDPQSRLRVEILQQRIDQIREIATTGLGPELGAAAGFNSLDGD